MNEQLATVLRRFTGLLLFLPALAIAGTPTSNFIRVPFGNGASIELPKNWVVTSENRRVTIDSYVEAMGYKLSESDLTFAANLYDDSGRTLAQVNTRFYPENELTQQHVRTLQTKDIASIDQQIRLGIEATSKLVGMRVTRWQAPRLQDIGPIRAFVHEHHQANPQNTVVVVTRGVRIWARPRSFVVTLSYRESATTWLLPIVDRMTSSIRLD